MFQKSNIKFLGGEVMKGIDDSEFQYWFSKICSLCKHYDTKNSQPKTGGNVCDAFPDGIPDKIWLGENDHKKPYKGDHNIQFEKA